MHHRLKKPLKFLKRNFGSGTRSGSNSIYPVSNTFGADRGTPIDRYYIENFLRENSQFLKGQVLEIAESTYSKRYDSGITSFEVLHFAEGNPNATIVADLTDPSTIPADAVDCFICTQTIHMIYDFKAAIAGGHKILKPGGIMLATVPGITQISRYDMDRWGDYWRFTTLSARLSFEEAFGKHNVTVGYHGNCYAATRFLNGYALEETDKKKLDINDQDYPLIITIRAQKSSDV